jgi:hypothetical protein
MTKDEALKLALEALHGFISYLPLEHDRPQCDRYDKAITAIKEALAQPEQRTWIDLTEQEATYLWESMDEKDSWELLKRVEAKLKELNT